MDFRIADLYRRRDLPSIGAEYARPFRPSPRTAPFQMPSAVTAQARRFQPEPEAVPPPPMTQADVERWGAENRERTAASAKSVKEALRELEEKRDIPLLSAEGMRRHPIAAAFTLAAVHGARAGEEVERIQELDRQRRRQEREEAMQEAALEEQRAQRRAIREAPAPEGYARDPATGKVYRKAQMKPTEGAEPPAGERPPSRDYVWVPHKGWQQPREPREPRPEKAAAPPPGEKPPTPAHIWIPHKGWMVNPDYEKPTSRHLVVGEIAAARGRVAKYRQRLSELDELDAATEGQPESIRDQLRAAHQAEREQIQEAERAERAVIADREQEMLGRTGPADYTVEEWAELTDDEKAAYLRAHPGFKPTRRGFDASKGP